MKVSESQFEVEENKLETFHLRNKRVRSFSWIKIICWNINIRHIRGPCHTNYQRCKIMSVVTSDSLPSRGHPDRQTDSVTHTYVHKILLDSTHKHTHTHAHTQTRALAHTHTQTHTHTHTHTHTRVTISKLELATILHWVCMMHRYMINLQSLNLNLRRPLTIINTCTITLHWARMLHYK